MKDGGILAIMESLSTVIISSTVSGRRVVVAGVGRNCARYLKGVLKNLESLAAVYGEAAFVFVLSDCEDESHGILSGWLGSGRKGRIADLGVLADHMPLRTARIAHARNAYLDLIKNSPWRDFDHLIVVDLDNVMEAPIDLVQFGAAKRWLEASLDRVAVFANASPRYYDIWALRHERWCPGDCWHAIWAESTKEDAEAAKAREVFARQIVIPETAPPIAVRSAFGGIGLYKMQIAIKGRYLGTDDQGRETCEHVAFNEAIYKSGGRLAIFPALMLQAAPEHLCKIADFSPKRRFIMKCRRLVEILRPPWRRLVG